MPKNTPTSLPVILITGLLGSGKTTTLKWLLSQKPVGEFWGVIINEAGLIGIDAASLPKNQQTATLEVSGGCICCSAQLGLTQALNQLIGENSTLDRIFIEPTGLGHPAKLIDTIKKTAFLKPLHLATQFCILDPKQLTPERWKKSAVMRDLVTLADVIILNKTDTATPAQMRQAVQILKNVFPAKPHIIETTQGQIDLNRLTNLNKTQHPFVILEGLAEHQQFAQFVPVAFKSTLPQVSTVALQSNPHSATLGWVFAPTIQFNRTKLLILIKHWKPNLLRMKGVIRTGNQWQLLNVIEQGITFKDIAWRQDNRLEVIVNQPWNATQAHQFEAQLSDALVERP